METTYGVDELIQMDEVQQKNYCYCPNCGCAYESDRDMSTCPRLDDNYIR